MQTIALSELTAFLARYPSDAAGRTMAMEDWAAEKQIRPMRNHRVLPDTISRMRKQLREMQVWAHQLVAARAARAAATKGRGKGVKGRKGKKVSK